MWRIVLLLSLVTTSHAQLHHQIDTIGQGTGGSGTYVKQLESDSLSSCFVIVIPSHVKLHKHAWHSETVSVLDGEGLMRLGEKQFKIKKGDLVFIPCNTPHAATSTGNVPLKVLSVQSPKFDGSDRIQLEP